MGARRFVFRITNQITSLNFTAEDARGRGAIKDSSIINQVNSNVFARRPRRALR